MKLLFTLDESGSDAINEALGFTDSDFKALSLKRDLYAATDELVELIGTETYKHIQSICDIEAPDEVAAELLFRARAVVALNAYRAFAPNNDISHSNNGRTARVEEGQKQPWQWQIEESNKALERQCYKAIDALLTYMDAGLQVWKESEAYKASHNLIVRTTKDFDDYFDIGRSRLLLIKLMPGLRIAESKHIKPRLGAERYAELKTSLSEGAEDINTKLVEKIKEVCVYLALAWGMRRLSVQLFPEGVLQAKVSDRVTINAKTPALNNEAEAAAQSFDADAREAIADLEELIKAETAPPPVTAADKPMYPDFDCNDKFIST